MTRGLLVVLSVLLLAVPAAAAERASLTDIEDEVMCPVCGTALNVAESPQANDERRFIRNLIARGESKDQIKEALVREYGRSVLAVPKSSGFDITNWLVPAAVVAGCAALVAFLLPRWRRRSRSGPAPAAVTAPLSAADAARLDEDLARFDR